MTNEAPKGVKSNMMVSFTSDQISDQQFFESNPKPEEFKTLLYGLCFFHAVLQERRAFGPLGWNILYDFNQSDLRISARQLHILLSEYDEIPFNALHYMVGECNYGGRVTDDRDRRILQALMQDFFSSELLEENFSFRGDQAYQLPSPDGSHSDYLKHIEENLPSHQSPEIFGFHSNGVIVRDLKETDDLCTALLTMMGGSALHSGNSGDTEAELRHISNEVLAKIPKRFDPELVAAKYPITYENSLNTVLQQEIIRYNNLTKVIVSSLKDIENALLGTVVMSSILEKVCSSLLQGLVPDLWKKASYPSMKPLGSYVSDLVRRLKYYQNWIDGDTPRCHWISGFYFTQTFLTATLQNYARKYQIPIDSLVFEYDFLGEPTSDVEQQVSFIHIDDGALMHGLFLEGCKWDFNTSQLVESDPKILSVLSPIIWLRPVELKTLETREVKSTYSCPVYKTAERKGTLSTTGHSTNFIMSIDMPTPTSHPSLHWVKRGVAMLCQLSD